MLFRSVDWKRDAGQYYYGDEVSKLDAATPYGPALTLPGDSLRADWERVNVAFMMQQTDTLHSTNLVVQKVNYDGGVESEYYPPRIIKVGQWDFSTYDLPVDSAMRAAQQVKIFVYNPSDDAVQLKCMDISFRPAYLKPGVKGQSMK